MQCNATTHRNYVISVIRSHCRYLWACVLRHAKLSIWSTASMSAPQSSLTTSHATPSRVHCRMVMHVQVLKWTTVHLQRRHTTTNDYCRSASVHTNWPAPIRSTVDRQQLSISTKIGSFNNCGLWCVHARLTHDRLAWEHGGDWRLQYFKKLLEECCTSRRFFASHPD